MPTPKIWMSTTYRSRYSSQIQGHLSVEGANRQEALALLKRLAVEAEGAAGEHARLALTGKVRHTLVQGYQTAYAAKDGYWRGWSIDSWQHTPPTSYAKWMKEQA